MAEIPFKDDPFVNYTIPLSFENFQFRMTILSELFLAGAITKKEFKKRRRILHQEADMIIGTPQ